MQNRRERRKLLKQFGLLKPNKSNKALSGINNIHSCIYSFFLAIWFIPKSIQTKWLLLKGFNSIAFSIKKNLLLFKIIYLLYKVWLKIKNSRKLGYLGLEPRTNRLKAEYSTVELATRIKMYRSNRNQKRDWIKQRNQNIKIEKIFLSDSEHKNEHIRWKYNDV